MMNQINELEQVDVMKIPNDKVKLSYLLGSVKKKIETWGVIGVYIRDCLEYRARILKKH